MKSRMPERARTDPWEPQGSNPLGPPGPELLGNSLSPELLPNSCRELLPDSRWRRKRDPRGARRARPVSNANEATFRLPDDEGAWSRSRKGKPPGHAGSTSRSGIISGPFPGAAGSTSSWPFSAWGRVGRGGGLRRFSAKTNPPFRPHKWSPIPECAGRSGRRASG